MIFSNNTRKKLFVVLAIFSLLAAIYHLTGVFCKINESPVWRHALFVGINLFCVFGFLKRPNYFIYFFCLLFLQQYYSHGRHLIKLWHAQHAIHWISLFVLIALPVGLICLLEDSKTKKNLPK